MTKETGMLVQKLRLQRGWSQEDLAELSALSVRTIQRIERGHTASAESLKALASVFEVDFSFLREPEMDKPKEPTVGRDEALALARQSEGRSDLPFAHLLHGEILLERDPTNPAPAEEAFQTAIAIAQEQGARSWGLRAALSLARLYCSTGRPTEAHAVLAPALESFSPTPEMPEIAEAQALLAGLAQATA